MGLMQRHPELFKGLIDNDGNLIPIGYSKGEVILTPEQLKHLEKSLSFKVKDFNLDNYAKH